MINRLSERGGVRLQPVHYYSEVPDRAWLGAHRKVWARPVSLPGVVWNLDEQLAWLEKVCRPYLREVVGLSSWSGYGTDSGPGYGAIESQVMHCVVRDLAPPRVVEVGSGVSTALMRDAVARNVADGRSATAITCVEPYPRPGLRRLPDVTIIEQPAQEVGLAVFDQLREGDLLFIDSTHALRTGSELARLYLEVLPGLRPGVVVHIHDIYLPYLYAPDVLDSVFDWQETTLLAALLTNNPQLSVLACESALHHERSAALSELLPDYRPRPMTEGLYAERSAEGHFPSSLWLKVSAGA